MKNIYQVIEDGKVIFEGMQKDICERFNVKKSNVSACYTKKLKLFKKYEIVKRKETAIKTKDEKLDYLVKHLLEYGNTCLNECPNKYEKALNQFGINITYRKVKSVSGIGRKNYFYVIERVK